MAKQTKTKSGRPSKYATHVKPKLKQITKWAQQGLWEWQIADKLGISRDSFIQYKKKYSDFSDALREGNDLADQEVKNALFKRAVGFKYDEITFEKIDSKVNLEITPDTLITTDAYKKKIVTKHVVPDVSAATYWLKKRRPVEFGDDPVPPPPTDEQLASKLAGALQARKITLIEDGNDS